MNVTARCVWAPRPLHQILPKFPQMTPESGGQQDQALLPRENTEGQVLSVCLNLFVVAKCPILISTSLCQFALARTAVPLANGRVRRRTEWAGGPVAKAMAGAGEAAPSCVPGERAQSPGESEPAVDKWKGLDEVREKEEPECALGGGRGRRSVQRVSNDSADHCGLMRSYTLNRLDVGTVLAQEGIIPTSPSHTHTYTYTPETRPGGHTLGSETLSQVCREKGNWSFALRSNR